MQSGGMDSITNGTLRAAEAVRQFLASTAPMGSNNTDGVPDYPLLTAYSRVMRRYYYNVSDPHARVYEAPELFRLMLHDPELCAHAPMPWLASITLSASLRWWSMVKKVLSPDLAQRRGPSIGTSSLTAPASVMEGAERCRHVADDIEVALQLLVSLSSPYRHQRHPPAAVGCTARSLLCQRPCVAYLTLLLNINNNNRNDIGYPVLQLIAHSWGSSPSMADILHQCWDRYREAKQQLLLLSHTPSEGVEEGETQKDGAGDAPPSPAPMRWEGLPGLPTHPSDVLPPSSLSSTSGGLDVVEIAWACMVSMATAAQDCFELLWWARSRLLALSSLDLRIKEVLDDVDAHTFFAEVWACEELCQEILADVEVPRALVSPPSTHANSRGVDGEAAWAKLHSMYTSLIGTVADLSSFWFRMYAFHGELQAPAENGIWMTIHRVAPSNPRFHSSHNDPTYADAWQIRLMVDQHLTQVLESGKRFGAQVYLAHLTSLLKNYPDYYPDLLVLTLGRQFVSDHTKAVLPLGLVDALTTCLRYHLPVMPLPPPSLLLSSAAFTSSSAAPSSSATPTPPPTTTTTEESTAAGDASASPAEPCPSDARSTDGTQPSSRFYNAAEYRCKEDETMDTLCALYAGTSPLPIASYKAIHACLSVLKVCVESAGHTSTNPLSLLLAEAQELRRGFSSSARYEHFKTHGRSPDACGPQRSNLITLLHALMRQPRYGGLSSMAMMLFSACIHHSVQDMVPLLRDHGLLTSILSHIHRPACSRMLQDAGMKMKLASLCMHDDAMTVEHRYLMDEIPILALPTLIQAFSVHQSTHELFTRHRRWFERVFDAFLSAPFDAEELVSEGCPWKVGEWREAEGGRNANTTIRNVPIPSSTSSSSVVADTPVDPRTNLLLCVRSKYRLARSSESEHRLTSLQNIFAMMMDLPEICSIATTMVEVHVPRMELPTDESFINRCSAMDGMVLSLLQAMQIVVVGSDVAGKRRGRDVEKLREFLQSLGDLIGEWLDALLKLCSTNSGTSFRVEAVAELLRSSIFGCAVMALRRTGEMNDPITAVLHKFVAGALGRLKGATSRNSQQRGRRGRQQLSEADAAILLQILHAVGFSQQRRKDASHELGTWLANVYLCIVPWTRPSGVVSGGDAGGDASRYTQDGPSMEVEAGGEEDATSGLYSMLVYGNTGQSGQATSQSMYLPGFSDDLPMQLFSRRVASREAAAMAASALIAPSYLSPAVATASAGDGGGATAAAAEPQIGWGSILESSINVRQYLNTPYQVPPLPPIEMDDDDEGGEDDDDPVDEPAAVFVDDDPDRLLRCQGSYADAFCRQMGRGLTILARGQEASSTYSARLAPRDRNLHVVPNKELLSPGATLKLDQELLRLISAAATAHLLVQPPHDGVADGAGEVMMPLPHEAVQSFRAMVLRGLNLRMLREHALRATIVEASFRGGNHSQAYQAVSEVMAVFLSRVIMMMLIICDDGEHHPLRDADLQAKLDAVKQEFLLLMWPISRFALHRRYCLLDAHSGMEVVGLSTCLIYLFFVLWPTLKLPDMPAHLAITAVELLHEVIAHPNGRRARIDLNPEKEDPKNAYIKQLIMPVGLLLPLKVHAAMWAVVWSLHDDALHHRMMPFTNETRGVASSIQTYTTTNTTPEEMVKSDEEVAAALAPRPLTWKMKDFAVDAAKWVADIIARCNANNCRSNTAARETSESAALQMRQQCVLTLWRISTISCTGTPDASYPAPDRPGAAFTAVLAGEEVGDEMLSRIVFVVDNEVSGVPLLLKRVLMDPRRNACLLEYCAVLLSQLNVTPALEILARTPLPKLIFTAITRVVKELQDSLHGLPRGQDEEAEKVRRADVRYECRCLLAQLLNFLALCRNLRPLNTNGQFHACPDISRASICRHGHQCPHVHAMEPPTEVDAECAYIILQTDYFLQNQGIAGGDCIHYAREAYAHRKTYGRSRVPCSLLDEALCVEVWEYLQQYLESVFTNDERMGDSWEEVHGAATSSSSSPSSSSPSRTMERMMHACDTDTSVSVSGVPLTMLVAQVASQILDTHAASPAFVAPLHSLRGSSLRITHWCIYLLCSAGRGYETLLPALRQLITDQERMLIPTYDAIQSTVELLVALQRGGCQRLPRAEVRQLMEEMRSGGTTTHTGEMNTCTNNTHAEVGVEDEVPRASHHLIPLSSLLKALPRQFLQNPTGLTDTIMKYCRLRWMQSRMPQDAVGVWVAPPPPPVSIRSTTAEDAERFCVILIRTLILTHHRGQLTDIDVSNILGVVLTAPGLEKLLLEPTFSTAVGCYAALPWFSYFGLHNNSNDTAQRANSAHSTMDHGSNNNNINVRTILDLGITQDALPRQFYSLLSGRASCAEELHAALRHCVAATCSNPGGREVVRGGGRAAHMDPDVDGGMGGGELHEPQHHRPRSHAYRQQQPHALATRCHTNQANNAQTSSKEALYVDISNGDAVWALLHIMCGVLDSADGPQVERDLCRLGTLPLLYEIIRLHRCRTIQQASLLLLLVRRVRLSTRQLHFATRQLQQNNKNNSNAVAVGPTDAMGGGGDWSLHAEEEEVSEDWQRVVQPLIRRDNTNNGRTTTFTRGNNNNDARNSSSNTSSSASTEYYIAEEVVADGAQDVVMRAFLDQMSEYEDRGDFDDDDDDDDDEFGERLGNAMEEYEEDVIDAVFPIDDDDDEEDDEDDDDDDDDDDDAEEEEDDNDDEEYEDEDEDFNGFGEVVQAMTAYNHGTVFNASSAAQRLPMPNLVHDSMPATDILRRLDLMMQQSSSSRGGTLHHGTGLAPSLNPRVGSLMDENNEARTSVYEACVRHVGAPQEHNTFTQPHNNNAVEGEGEQQQQQPPTYTAGQVGAPPQQPRARHLVEQELRELFERGDGRHVRRSTTTPPSDDSPPRPPRFFRPSDENRAAAEEAVGPALVELIEDRIEAGSMMDQVFAGMMGAMQISLEWMVPTGQLTRIAPQLWRCFTTQGQRDAVLLAENRVRGLEDRIFEHHLSVIMNFGAPPASRHESLICCDLSRLASYPSFRREAQLARRRRRRRAGPAATGTIETLDIQAEHARQNQRIYEDHLTQRCISQFLSSSEISMEVHLPRRSSPPPPAPFGSRAPNAATTTTSSTAAAHAAAPTTSTDAAASTHFADIPADVLSTCLAFLRFENPRSVASMNDGGLPSLAGHLAHLLLDLCGPVASAAHQERSISIIGQLALLMEAGHATEAQHGTSGNTDEQQQQQQQQEMVSGRRWTAETRTQANAARNLAISAMRTIELLVGESRTASLAMLCAPDRGSDGVPAAAGAPRASRVKAEDAPLDAQEARWAERSIVATLIRALRPYMHLPIMQDLFAKLLQHLHQVAQRIGGEEKIPCEGRQQHAGANEALRQIQHPRHASPLCPAPLPASEGHSCNLCLCALRGMWPYRCIEGCCTFALCPACAKHGLPVELEQRRLRRSAVAMVRDSSIVVDVIACLEHPQCSEVLASTLIQYVSLGLMAISASSAHCGSPKVAAPSSPPNTQHALQQQQQQQQQSQAHVPMCEVEEALLRFARLLITEIRQGRVRYCEQLRGLMEEHLASATSSPIHSPLLHSSERQPSWTDASAIAPPLENISLSVDEGMALLHVLDLRRTESYVRLLFELYARSNRPQHPEIARLWHAIDIYMKMITATVRSVREKQVGLIPPSVLRVIQLFCDFHMAMPRSAASQSAASLSYASLAGGETERFLVDSASAPSLVSNQASAAARQRAMDEVQRARGRRDTEWGLADDVVFADAGDAGFDQGGGRWMQQRGTSTGLSASPFVNLVHGGASSGTPASASASASAALGGGVGGPTSSGELNEEVRPRLPPMVRKFLDINRATINNLLHLRPELLHGALSYVLWEPSLIDFAFKRRDFLRRMASPRSNRISFAIRRSHCLEDTFVELNKMRNFDGPLHVRFVREEGVDMGGLTREWFGLLAKAFTDPLHALFTQCGTESYQPNPLSWANPHHLDYFHVVGLVLALAVRNGVAFDMHLTRAMYRHLLGNAPIFADLESVDRDIFVQYRRLLDADVNELGLNFVVDIHRFDVVTEEELVPNGRDVAVTNENKSQYVHKMANFRMTRSIEEQLLAFLKGFYTVIPRHHIQLFTELELELLICGTPDIDVDDLRANTHYDGYTSSSTQILWFWVAVAQMNKEDRANLLQFATGSSKVPAGGFSSLAQMRSDSRPYAFTINRWIPDDPEALPRAHTCFNTIDLPEYHSAEMLRDKLRLAITYGNVGFALT